MWTLPWFQGWTEGRQAAVTFTGVPSALERWMSTTLLFLRTYSASLKRLNGLLWHCEVEQESRLMSQPTPKPVTLITVRTNSPCEQLLAFLPVWNGREWREWLSPRSLSTMGSLRKYFISSPRTLTLILGVSSSFPHLLFSLRAASSYSNQVVVWPSRSVFLKMWFSEQLSLIQDLIRDAKSQTPQPDLLKQKLEVGEQSSL